MPRTEIDQSGQMGRFNTDTVLAFSDGLTHAIVLPAWVKREAHRRLTQKYRQLKEPYLKLFSAGLFLLIRDYLDRIEQMFIDEEFTGKESAIRGQLLSHIRAHIPTFPKERVVFGRIGKKSAAHRLALEIYRARKGRSKTAHPYKVITLAELLEVLQLK